jgi:myo-inositol-1-phosphate synthase
MLPAPVQWRAKAELSAHLAAAELATGGAVVNGRPVGVAAAEALVPRHAP